MRSLRRHATSASGIPAPTWLGTSDAHPRTLGFANTASFFSAMTMVTRGRQAGHFSKQRPPVLHGRYDL